jgi:crossover junction endodeoxyribonuclease RuvC
VTGPAIRVVGLDLSHTATGICDLDNTLPAPTPRCTTIRTAGLTGHPRQRHILTQIDMAIHAGTRRADIVAIEGPGTRVGAASAHIIDTAKLHGIVDYHIARHGIPYVEIPPAVLKIYATGSGNAPKDDVLLAVERRYGHLIRVADNNQADALILAAMTLHHYGRILVAVPQTHARALTSIKTWPDLPDLPRPSSAPLPPSVHPASPGNSGRGRGSQRSMP